MQTGINATNGSNGSKLVTLFKAARRVSTPLVCVRTPDPTATMATLSAAIAQDAPRLVWDCVRGPQPLNQPNSEKPSQESNEAIARLLNGQEPRALCSPVECLVQAAALPKSSILFFLNAHSHFDNPQVVQAIWNLRDIFKANRRTLVILCPSVTLPAEIQHDVTLLDEPLPTAQELREIITAQCTAADGYEPDEKTMERAIDATLGLAAFSAEQVTAMSLTKNGLDLDGLWERKRTTIEQTPGLEVWRGNESFKDVRGADNVIGFLQRTFAGEEAPRAIGFFDEIEKAMAGAAGDTTGVSQDTLMSLLAYMQDHNSTGMIFIGPPGSGKSFVAKAAGNRGGIPTIKVDLGGMKGSHVGESEQRLRQALKVIEAVSQGRALFIATCNSISALPPELRRRFKFGTFFFDLPTAEERKQLWALYMTKYNRRGKPPEDTGWTGAEIANCCDISRRLDCSLTEAGGYIVPVIKSAGDQIKRLRLDASGKFISASRPGLYTYEEEKLALTGRAIASAEE